MQPCSSHVQDDPGPERAGSAAPQAQDASRRARHLAFGLDSDRAQATLRKSLATGPRRTSAHDRPRRLQAVAGDAPAKRARSTFFVIVIDASALVELLIGG